MWSIGTWQVFRHAFVATAVLFAARELKFSAGHVGALFMVAGLGSLVATSVTERLNARYGFGPVMLAGLAGTVRSSSPPGPRTRQVPDTSTTSPAAR